MGQKEGVFYLLELKDQWGSQTIICYVNESAIAPVKVQLLIRGVTIKFANLPCALTSSEAVIGDTMFIPRLIRLSDNHQF